KGLTTSDKNNVMDGDVGSGSAKPGPTRNSCLNAFYVALGETRDGKSWYTSTKELQLASLEFCMACRAYKTLHLIVDVRIPRMLLAAADGPVRHPKRLSRTRVPRLRARHVTWNMPTAAELRSPIFALMELDHLEFGGAFEGSLDAVTWPRRLESIAFHNFSPFNTPIDLVKWPASLKRLAFGNSFNQAIEHVEFPASLRQIVFAFFSCFNQPIAGVILPTCLQKLALGASFNHPIEDVTWPPFLQELIFGKYFNQPIQRAKFPASLQKLRFDQYSCFNQPMAGVVLPTSLQQLALGASFNHPLDDVAWPTSLQELIIGKTFNQPIG
ncbi:unnamed protein product, partial [Ectocarpus sp. 12 AP-2014]